MAITQAMTTSFKAQLLLGVHDFRPSADTGADVFKLALYTSSASLDANTTAYTASNEVSSSGTNYTAGGVIIATATTPLATNTSATAGVGFVTPSGNFIYTNVTLSTAFDAVLLYNNTQSNKAVSVHTFGSQTITAGTFTLTMPNNTTSLALIRLATT